MAIQKLSRRRLLGAVPAVAATITPVTATALCRLPRGDAVLMALGRKLEPLVAEITAAREIDKRHQENFNAKLAGAQG
jgi:hypothetical protein